MRFRAVFVSSAALSICLGSAAAAAPAKAKSPAATSEAPSLKPKTPPSFAEMMKIVDKLFPPQPEPDPARLALARTSVQSIWPDGAYARMMTGLMDKSLQ